MNQRIIIAGFGGQGILSAGRFLAYAAMLEGKNVSWLPSYGPEMRGGTANCHVIITDDDVGSPILNEADMLIAMTRPSLEKFENTVRENGLIIVDSSLVESRTKRSDVRELRVPATEAAQEFGNVTFANIILIGKLIKETGIVTRESFQKALDMNLPEKYKHMIPEEMKALEYGMNYETA